MLWGNQAEESKMICGIISFSQESDDMYACSCTYVEYTPRSFHKFFTLVIIGVALMEISVNFVYMIPMWNDVFMVILL